MTDNIETPDNATNTKPMRYFVVEGVPTVHEFNRKRDVAKKVQDLKAAGNDCFIVKGKQFQAQVTSIPQVTLV